MLDFSKLNKNDYKNFFETKNPENFNLFEFNSFVLNHGIENFFDKCLIIDWAKDEAGWNEIDSPNSWITSQYDSNQNIFQDSSNPENLKKQMLEKNYKEWDKESQEYFNNLETGSVPQGPHEWSRTYVCYAYEIINFKKEKIIAHDIYCVFDRYTINEKFYNSFDELRIEIDKLFIASDWGTDFIQTSFG